MKPGRLVKRSGFSVFGGSHILTPARAKCAISPRLNILRFIGVDFSECRSLSCPQTSYCAYLVRVIPIAPRANFFTGGFILADNLPQPRRFYSKYLRGFSCRNKVRMRIVFAFLNAEDFFDAFAQCFQLGEYFRE